MAKKSYDLSEFVERKRDQGAVEIVAGGQTFTIDPPEVWSDEVLILSTTDPVGAARALMGEQYEPFVAAGGSASRVLAILQDAHGVTLGE